MKKLFLSFVVLCCAVVAQAQENLVMTAVLQHGSESSLFIGANSFVTALNAAEDGDVITLSSGMFNSPGSVTKEMTIYGAGFEENEAESTEQTIITGGFYVGDAERTLSGIHIEGLRINGDVYPNYPLNQFILRKCFLTGHYYTRADCSNLLIDQCVVSGNVTSNGYLSTITNFLVSNSYVGAIFNFTNESTVVVDHCVIPHRLGRNDGTSKFTWTNCIFVCNANYNPSWDSDYRFVGNGSVVKNCIHHKNSDNNWNGFVGSQYENCWLVPLGEIFTDGTDGAYTPERTYELQQPDVWVGTDGRPVGCYGWSKAPATPVVKNLNTEVQDTQLKVTYDAQTR